jgi:L-lactate dehydrogenase complex protein LldE
MITRIGRGKGTPLTTPSPERPDRVYFFGTCLMDAFSTDAALAGVRLIEREGVRVVYPPGQTCCGQPAYNSGFREEAKAVAARQVGLFPEQWPVIVPSGSCAATMKHHYPRLFLNDPLLPQVEAFSARVFELTEFLVNVLHVRLEDRGEPVRVTWHSSCRAARELGIRDEPKMLLRQLRNVQLIELQHETECCGFGGAFAVKQPEVSAAIVEDKVNDICASGAEYVLALDTGCLLNIGGTLQFRNRPVIAKHIAEFLWERVRD